MPAADSSFDLKWLIDFVLIPAMAGLLWLVQRNRDVCDKSDEAIRKQVDENRQRGDELRIVTEKLIADNRRACDMQDAVIRDDLNKFQLRVASDCVVNQDMKDFSTQFAASFAKIDNKLDKIDERLLHLEQRRDE